MIRVWNGDQGYFLNPQESRICFFATTATPADGIAQWVMRFFNGVKAARTWN
jgi:hypothetical protein